VGNALWLPKLFVFAIKKVLAARIMKLKPNVVYTIFRLKGFSFAFNKTAERVEGVPLFLI